MKKLFVIISILITIPVFGQVRYPKVGPYDQTGQTATASSVVLNNGSTTVTLSSGDNDGDLKISDGIGCGQLVTCSLELYNDGNPTGFITMGESTLTGTPVVNSGLVFFANFGGDLAWVGAADGFEIYGDSTHTFLFDPEFGNVTFTNPSNSFSFKSGTTNILSNNGTNTSLGVKGSTGAFVFTNYLGIPVGIIATSTSTLSIANGSFSTTLDSGALLTAGGSGQLQLLDETSKPTCDSSKRGTIWYGAGGAGVADTIEICGKSAADTYSWVALATF